MMTPELVAMLLCLFCGWALSTLAFIGGAVFALAVSERR